VRRLALALAALFLMPAAAKAAPFGELPFQALPSPARCLQATGVPGELLRWAPDGAEVFQATRSGFGAPVHVVLGAAPSLCPLAVTQPSGAALIAQRPYDGGFDLALRDPGGDWHAERIPEASASTMADVSAAVSPHGDAVIGWLTQGADGDAPYRLMVARRPAGGRFGEPVELEHDGRYPPHIELGMQGDGTVVALIHNEGRLIATTAAPGAPFGARQELSTKIEDTPRVAVAPDGRALALVPESDARTRIFERPPGGTFAPIGSIAYADTFFGGLALALRPDGGAIVTYKDYDDQVLALRRDRPGGFGPPEKVGPRPPDPSGPDSPIEVGDVPGDGEGRDMQVAFAPDGRPVLTWSPSRTTRLFNWADAAVTAFGGDAQMLGSPLRDADSITPVILADGTPAAAWSDVSPGGDAHLHLAIEGLATAPEPAAPRIGFGRVTQLHKGLVLPFDCSAACDVRATVPGGSSGRRSLRAAGSGRLTIKADLEPMVLTRPDSVAVQVMAGAPGARTVQAATLTAKLKVPRLPRVLGLRAVRRGRHVTVSWHGSRPLYDAHLIVSTTPTRARKDPYGKVVDASGQRRFRVKVKPNRGDRFIQLYLVYEPDATQRRIGVARIT
jgi:hypothetical protein